MLALTTLRAQISQLRLPWLAFLLLACALLQPAHAQSFTILEDNFDDGVINTTIWKNSGYTVTEHDGYADLRADVTDNNGNLSADFAPLSKFRLEVRHMMHAGSPYYFPSFYFNSVIRTGNDDDGGVSVTWRKSDYAPDNCNNSANYDKVAVGANGDSCFARSQTNSSSYYDKWIVSVIEYDSVSGLFTVDFENNGVIDLQAVVPANKRNLINRLGISTYGWWTGHYHRLDYVRLTSGSNTTPATSQTITFGTAPTVVVGGTGTVSATGGSSGLPVTFSSLTTSICSVSGSTVTGMAAGTCTIAANQAGNANYSAAPQATQSFNVVAPTTYTYSLAVNSSGATGVAIAASPTLYSGWSNYSKTGIAAGTSLTLTAPYSAGSATFNYWSGCDAASGVTCALTLNAARNVTAVYRTSLLSQSITFGAMPILTVGGTGTVSATASSGLPVTYSSLTTGICTLSGSTVRGIAAGTCSIAGNQAGNDSYGAAAQQVRSFSVTAVSGINCSTSAFPFSLCDEFSGTAINTSVWKQTSAIRGEYTVGNSSTVHDGYLDLRQDETDNGGAVVTRFAPQKHLRVMLTHNMHAATDYFMPYLGIGPVSLGWVRSNYGPDYCSQAGNFDRPRLIMAESSTGDNCNNSVFGNVASSSFYDRWSTAVVEYDMDTGLVTVDLDNDGTIDLRATVPLASRVPVTAVTLHGYGWFTGHWHRVDAIKIEGTPLGNSGGINDTGIDYCRDHATGADTPVTATTTCTPAQGGQDARYGRDAAASKGSLSKVGGGGKGFDFTKIANSGTRLPASAALGSAVTDWACTYDNNTGLMWEVKTSSGLHNQSHSYTWYDSVHNYGGSSGAASGGTCQTAGRCDTEKFVADVNAADLCGHNDWRMPTFQELNNLVDRGRSNPAIDPTYFPNTPAFDFWSGSPWAGVYGGSSDISWNTDFSTGYGHWNYRSFARQVRLVRAGQ